MTDAGKQSLVLVEPAPNGMAGLAKTLAVAGFETRTVPNLGELYASVGAAPPACLIVGYHPEQDPRGELLAQLKSDKVFGQLPALLAIPSEHLDAVDWSRYPADDFIPLPVPDGEAAARVRLCIARAQRDLNANPLTGLPGNLTIMAEASRRLEAVEPFAMGYLDLDHFKPYNDRYGFGRGDEVLRMTARVLVNVVRGLKSPDTYVGHVGGDDFIFMTPCDIVERACKEIIENFALLIPNFYDEEDRARGAIESVDRQGNPQRFPLMTCSIAAVETGGGIRHVGDLSSRAAEIKKEAKKVEGSHYMLDRRA